jgi:WD40 repeat protein
MSAPDNAKGYVDKAGRPRAFPLSLLVLVAVCCAHAVAKENPGPRQPEDSIIYVGCSPSGALVATARDLGSVNITDVASGKVVMTVEKELVEPKMAFSPDDRLFVISAPVSQIETGLKLWALDKAKGKAVSKGYLHSPGPELHINCMTFSPDGRTLAIGCLGVHVPSFKSYGEVHLLDVASREKLRTLKGEMDGVYSLAFSADGKTLAVGTGQGSAHSLDQKGGVQFWDVNSGQLQSTLKPAERISWVNRSAFSPDGKTLATVAPRIEARGLGWQLLSGVELWNVATGKERNFLKEANARHNLVFSADSKTLATADHLWDTETGKQRATLEKVLAPLTFSTDGKRLATLQFDGSVNWTDIDKLPK